MYQAAKSRGRLPQHTRKPADSKITNRIAIFSSSHKYSSVLAELIVADAKEHLAVEVTTFTGMISSSNQLYQLHRLFYYHYYYPYCLDDPTPVQVCMRHDAWISTSNKCQLTAPCPG
jgi:hypothetical protein